MFSKTNFKRGITLIEILMVVAILGILTGISVSSFRTISNTKTLDKEAEVVLSYINRTRTNAINSLNLEAHGVSFASSTVTIYYGTSAVTAASSSVYTLSGGHTISGVSLSNGATNFYFNKLSGEPSATGSITIRNQSGDTKTITIYGTGLSEVQ